eukprot:GEMP01027229.1.p1 GENE.GEMP01027229.1~~GEMP01027229.1.p1  ORF type:complete len:403 (+),score=64.47 GEMP01027229.1:37-1209(+)
MAFMHDPSTNQLHYYSDETRLLHTSDGGVVVPAVADQDIDASDDMVAIPEYPFVFYPTNLVDQQDGDSMKRELVFHKHGSVIDRSVDLHATRRNRACRNCALCSLFCFLLLAIGVAFHVSRQSTPLADKLNHEAPTVVVPEPEPAPVAAPEPEPAPVPKKLLRKSRSWFDLSSWLTEWKEISPTRLAHSHVGALIVSSTTKAAGVYELLPNFVNNKAGYKEPQTGCTIQWSLSDTEWKLTCDYELMFRSFHQTWSVPKKGWQAVSDVATMASGTPLSVELVLGKLVPQNSYEEKVSGDFKQSKDVSHERVKYVNDNGCEIQYSIIPGFFSSSGEWHAMCYDYDAKDWVIYYKVEDNGTREIPPLEGWTAVKGPAPAPTFKAFEISDSKLD